MTEEFLFSKRGYCCTWTFLEQSMEILAWAEPVLHAAGGGRL